MAFNWKTFWNNLKGLGSDDAQEQNTNNRKIKQWDDVNTYNPLDVVVKKLGTLVNDEATFELESDSSLVEPLRALCKDIESKRYEICGIMLGKGGCFVTMATNEDSERYHRVLSQEDVSVYSISAGKIYEIAMVIDRKTIKRKVYTLIRHHYLDNQGTLYIYYYVLDSSNREAYVEEWEHYKNDNTAFYNANHIGVAYFKSPQDSNGLESFFGVPLNFACKEEEEKLIDAKRQRQDEMSNAEMILFVDDSITVMSEDALGNRKYKLPEKIYTIRKQPGIDGKLIDVHAPQTRYSDYRENEIAAGHDYEDRMGLNAGFVTPPEYTAGATATEIRTANAKTISMMKKVQTAMHEGICETLIVDNILSLIPMDLWSLKIDWFDPFEDVTAQYERVLNAAENGYAEAEDVIRFLFPNLTQKEIEEKMERIKKSKESDSNSALERIFAGE